MRCDLLYKAEFGMEKEKDQLLQFASILRHHVKFVMMIMDDGKKVALAPEMIEMLGKAVLHLSRTWNDNENR